MMNQELEMTEQKKTESFSNKAFERHIRRHVWAPAHGMAAIVPPELAPLCRDELGALGISQAKITEAGVEFSARLADCYRLNLWLRTASRILLRLPQFRAGAVEELFKKSNGLQWELWLNPTIPIELETFVRQSRIEHEGATEEAVRSAIEKRFALHGLPSPRILKAGEEEPASIPAKQRVIIYLRQNRCEISLDTTGPHMHQRGYRLRHTGAPLRETLAAALLIKSGWREDLPLVDGMCGAGTLAIEAAHMARHIAPGARRHFLFEKWPSFRREQWSFILRKAEEQALSSSPSRIVALDRSGSAIETARQNAARAGVDEDIEWASSDFFEFEPKDHQLGPGWIALNPPYGKRLEGGGRGFYEELGLHLQKSFKGWHAAVLAPDRGCALALRLPAARFWNITHGGIPLTVAIGRVGG